MTFEEILGKLEIGMADFLGESASETFVKVWTYLTGLHTTVKNAPKTNEGSGEKVDPAYVVAWKADKASADQATKIMAVIVTNLAKHEGNPALMFHLREQSRAMLGKYLSSEVDWNEYLAEKEAGAIAPVSQSTRSLMAAEYQAGRLGLTQIYGLIGHSLSVPGEMISADGKNTVPNLPALPGNYGANGGASGANAKVYRLSYNVNGTDYGTDAKLALRAIFVGPNRAGKTTTDLATLLESKVKNVYGITEPATFKYDGRTVTISRPADK